MNRRQFFRPLVGGIVLLSLRGVARAKTFLSPKQAQTALWGEKTLTPQPVELTQYQRKSIKKVCKVRVRNSKVSTWRTDDGDWFILDQVIGKHENIDIAVGLNADGSVKGIEVLVYRETYGHEVMNPKWLAQFIGKTHKDKLKLDKQIQNISGATLSSAHITDGINRLCETWEQVLRHLPLPER